MEANVLSGKNCFFIRAIFLLVKAIIGIRGKQFSKEEIIIAIGQLTFWLVETVFFLYFPGSCQLQVFFRLVETIFQENPLFRLVETDFRANNGFRKKREKL